MNFHISGSFRDPSGFLFTQNGSLYRQINQCYKSDYDLLMNSGLFKELVDKKLLINHIEVNDISQNKDSYKTIEPERIPFISYPYEWSFSQLKNAALTTLKIQKIALKYGLSLKDSSAYNIQFLNGKPIFIDTLSFEKHKDGQPWIAYRQFCQHFLAPLTLMAYTDIRLNQLLRIYIDGIPLDLAKTLLPWKTFLKLSILFHIYFHAKSQKNSDQKPVKEMGKKVSKTGLLGIIDSLENSVKKLYWSPEGSTWADYYNDTNYISDAFSHKKEIVNSFLDKVTPNYVWDLGANDGTFSRIASNKNIQTISFDFDPAAVEKNYNQCVSLNEQHMLPLLLDLTNPSPGLGWDNTERESLIKRGPTKMLFYLALIHHLAIANNVPLYKIAASLCKLCQWLVIEFIPKSDSQVKRLLLNREDIFDSYDLENFVLEFTKFFTIKETVKIKNSERILYLMEVKKSNC